MRARRITCRHSVSSLSFLAIPLLLWPGLVHAADDFAAPTPQMIDLLRQQHAAKDWLRIRSGASRLELRVDRIDSDGLHGLHPRKRAPQPSMLPWSSIQRIDRRESRVRTGQMLGLPLGAVAGAYAGAATGRALIGSVVGGIAGAWLGAKLGDGIVRERPLYVPSPSPTPSELPTTTPAEIAATPPAPAGTSVDKVRARIKPADLVRITGDFGLFSGRVAGIDEQGLSGLQQDPAWDSSVPLPSEPLSWNEIHRVDRRGGSSRHYAGYVGVASGVAFGLMGYAIAGWGISPIPPGQQVAGLAGGAAMGVAIGAGVGAAIGAVVPRWNLVYRRPR